MKILASFDQTISDRELCSDLEHSMFYSLGGSVSSPTKWETEFHTSKTCYKG